MAVKPPIPLQPYDPSNGYEPGGFTGKVTSNDPGMPTQMVTTGGGNTPNVASGKRKNTAAQEQFISGLNTHGALDSGSGFDANFGANETNDQFSARLNSFLQGQSGGAGGGSGSGTPAVAALNAATQQPSVEGDGGGNATMTMDTTGFARQGLGRRVYPQDSAALSALGRAVY